MTYSAYKLNKKLNNWYPFLKYHRKNNIIFITLAALFIQYIGFPPKMNHNDHIEDNLYLVGYNYVMSIVV